MTPLAQRLLAVAHPLPDDPARAHVPEPIVKQALASYGIVVPRPDGDRLVLKAHGPGLVHKSEAGAVRLGLAPEDVEAARDEMAERLADAGTPAGGFLVEEQLPPGPELIVGVRATTFGPVVLLGVGGVMVEALDRAEARLAPLSADDAAALVRAVVPREGVVDLDAMARTVVGLTRFAEDLGPALAEVELNPVIGGVAADARLILHVGAAPDGGTARPPTDFGPLLAPRTVAVAGASATKETFGNRFLAAYRDAGWTDGLYALHPTAEAVDGVPAVASPADVPGGLDYLLVAVPAPACAPMVRAAAGHTRFAHVISGGFRETGADDAEADLLAAGREAGVRVLGPNCMGVFAPAGRQAFQLAAPRTAGPVAVICQSGGLAGDIIKGGDVRGVRFRAVVTIGNAVDVTPGELLAHFLADAGDAVVGLYVEDPRDGRVLVDALRAARKPVVALVGGAVGAGRGGGGVAHGGAGERPSHLGRRGPGHRPRRGRHPRGAAGLAGLPPAVDVRSGGPGRHVRRADRPRGGAGRRSLGPGHRRLRPRRAAGRARRRRAAGDLAGHGLRDGHQRGQPGRDPGRTGGPRRRLPPPARAVAGRPAVHRRAGARERPGVLQLRDGRGRPAVGDHRPARLAAPAGPGRGGAAQPRHRPAGQGGRHHDGLRRGRHPRHPHPRRGRHRHRRPGPPPPFDAQGDPPTDAARTSAQPSPNLRVPQ